ncbi:MAG TPA: hypothetical protein VHU13_03570 [Solirubrobacteraceae bacterium]|jgi:hypothetical protein|nr:hypothetical protein [Solirubrobacteraceae bacterium]
MIGRTRSLLLALMATALCCPAAPALASPLLDDGGASWRLEQPPPPQPPPGVTPSSTPVGLGHVGDVEFWAPNRGLLITAGNGSTILPGVWAYNGKDWHELSRVCGGTDGRIAWAGPDEFWTISDGRPGQAPDAHGDPAPIEDNTLCHFAGGRVVGSYASVAFRANSYQPMHAAGCIAPNDCWFAGDPLPAPQSGSFHLHWNGSSLSEEPYTQEGYAVQDARVFGGQLYESVQLAAPLQEPHALHLVNPTGVQPTFEPLFGLPLYATGEFPDALGVLRLSATDQALWAAAGPVRETPLGSTEGQVTVARYAQERWQQLIGPASNPSGAALFGESVVSSIAAEPESESAWLALDGQADAEQPSPTAQALVTRVGADGSVSSEDTLGLPEPGEGIGPKGAASKLACPGLHDCWLVTTQGWLFHLTDGESLPLDTDPAFAGLITERPLDEGVPQIPPDAPPTDDSGLLGEPPQELGQIPETPKPPEERVTVPLLSHLRSRLVAGTTLELSFRLAVKARIELIAERGKQIVAHTTMRELARGKRRLLLRLDRRRWPTKLQLKTHALAPLPTVSSGGSSNSGTVSTPFIGLPELDSLGLLS